MQIDKTHAATARDAAHLSRSVRLVPALDPMTAVNGSETSLSGIGRTTGSNRISPRRDSSETGSQSRVNGEAVDESPFCVATVSQSESET